MPYLFYGWGYVVWVTAMAKARVGSTLGSDPR